MVACLQSPGRHVHTATVDSAGQRVEPLSTGGAPMGWSLTLTRVRGIEIKVHATFVLILIWAACYCGADADDGARGVAFGVVATILLFLCVTLPELGHAVTAQRYGIEVRDITVLPIGGVARIEVPDNPRQELWIAL